MGSAESTMVPGGRRRKRLVGHHPALQGCLPCAGTAWAAWAAAARGVVQVSQQGPGMSPPAPGGEEMVRGGGAARRKRRPTVAGLEITGAPQVSEEALAQADRVLRHMLAGCHETVLQRLAGGEVAIIGRDEVTTDVPAHAFLRGQRTEDGRSFDEGVRGLGGTLAVPCTSAGEENLLMMRDDPYWQESILVHEFGHHVMNVGMCGAVREGVRRAFRAASEAELYSPQAYIASNEDEYFAEGTQAWFHATVRTDVTDGVRTRLELEARDPALADVMRRIWGENQWRYTDTMLGRWD